MPEFASHTPGTFSWAELASRDQKASVDFYRGLFGWEVDDRPIGADDTYSLFTLRGLEVAAAYTMRPEELQVGAPPRWNLYVSVDDADEAALRVNELGGKVISPPFDVMDLGRMAVLQDPTGGVFQVWEARNHIGARILFEPGALCWSELTTRDPGEAEFFYTALFEWTAEHTMSIPGTEYTQLANQGQESSIGIIRMPAGMSPGMPSYWMPYFQVTACDASVTKAQSLGALVMVPARDIPRTGRFAILQDPQGAMFAVFEQKP